jgi:hypothetical protein
VPTPNTIGIAGVASLVCEAALAHVRGDQTIRAYARGDLFDKRRKLMETWALYCAAAPSSSARAKVTPLRKAALV